MPSTVKKDEQHDPRTEDPGREEASKDADAGVAPEQAGTTPSEDEPDDEDLANEEVKRQDPPLPGQPKKIRVDEA